MKGKFKTLDGKIVEVTDFDAINKMASVHLGSGQYKWYTEAEYSTWVKDEDLADKPGTFSPTELKEISGKERLKDIPKESSEPKKK